MNRKCVTSLFIITLMMAFAFGVNGCRKTRSDQRHHTTPIPLKLPEGFPTPAYDFADPITEEGFALGRKLFHDNRLSGNNDVSCGSCHQQQAAYTTFDHDLGHGTRNQHTNRNVPSLVNLIWQKEFQWDGSVTSFSEQQLSCLKAPERMGAAIPEVPGKLADDAAYDTLFAAAFGDKTVSEDRIAKALTQYVALLISSDSKYDKMKKGAAVFNASEQNGYVIFQNKCTGCHAEPLFTDHSYRNTGLPMKETHHDVGRMSVTHNKSDSLLFKVPSLRNVALTGYYAHDGRFEAMSQMLDHYSSAIKAGPTVDPLVQNNISLTALEKFYLIEFLHTLTDSTLVSDPRFE